MYTIFRRQTLKITQGKNPNNIGNRSFSEGRRILLTHLVGYNIRNIAKIELDREARSYKLSFNHEIDGKSWENISVDNEPEKFAAIEKYLAIQNEKLLAMCLAE